MENKKKDSENIFKKYELQIIRDRQERQELLFRTEKLVRKPSVDRDIEQFELRSGRLTSLKNERDVIQNIVGRYNPMFPNSIPFFSLMYKLNGWNHLDPNSFNKPPICANWIKQYIYGRFDSAVLPTLLKMENPILYGHVKKYKLFQFLNDNGLLLLELFINEAIYVMMDSKNWYDFELKYSSKYDLSVQLKLPLQVY